MTGEGIIEYDISITLCKLNSYHKYTFFNFLYYSITSKDMMSREYRNFIDGLKQIQIGGAY